MKNWLQVYGHKRVLSLAALGFACGLPLLLTGSTLAAWLTNSGVALSTVGLFSLVGLPYSLKFVWAPLIDRFALPWLGRRRGWIVLTQLCVAAGLLALSRLAALSALHVLASVALFIAGASATQDIAADAYRTDLLEDGERAAGTAIFVLGYRIGMISSGATALILSERISWPGIYRLMALAMLFCVVATALCPSTRPSPKPTNVLQAISQPLVDFWRRPAAGVTLLFVVLYKFGDAVASTMITPFFIRLGFSNAEIGVLSKGLGLTATIAGSLAGGALVTQWGLRRSLFRFGVLQALTNCFYIALAMLGPKRLLLGVAILADQACGGMATTAYVAFLMTLCKRQYSATQYALLSSLSAVGARVVGASSGYAAESIGWPAFFFLTIVLAAPALAILHRLPEKVFSSPDASLAAAC